LGVKPTTIIEAPVISGSGKQQTRKRGDRSAGEPRGALAVRMVIAASAPAREGASSAEYSPSYGHAFGQTCIEECSQSENSTPLFRMAFDDRRGATSVIFEVPTAKACDGTGSVWQRQDFR
jgi:hypothetical protein